MKKYRRASSSVPRNKLAYFQAEAQPFLSESQFPKEEAKRKGRAWSFTLFLLCILLFSGCSNVTVSPSGTPAAPATPPVSGTEMPDSTQPPVSGQEPQETPPPPPSPPPVYPSVDIAGEWEDNGLNNGQISYSNTFKSGGSELLRANGTFPQTGSTDIDAYYTRCRDDFERMCGVLAEDAAQSGVGSTVWSCDAEFTVTCDSGGIFSVFRTVTKYLGGAHEGTEVICETFSIATGKLLTLDDFFTADRETFTARLLEFVDYAFDSDRQAYFENAKELARDFFPYDTFSITPDGITLLFPTYTVAPYAAGIVSIDIPWGAVSEIFEKP